MTKTSLLRKTADWEKACPTWAKYEHIFYNSNHEVIEVKGKIAVLMITYVAGKRSATVGTRNVRWNGEGLCFVGTQNVRNQKYDIHFK